MSSRQPSRGQPARSVYQAALDHLARRDASAAEIAARLSRLRYSPEQIEEALDRLRRQRFLDDAALADRYARSRRERAYGARRIEADLRHRGVGKNNTRKALEATRDDAREVATIDALARAAWKRHAKAAPLQRLARVYAFLVRRGFAPGLVLDRLGSLHPGLADKLEGSLDPPVED